MAGAQPASAGARRRGYRGGSGGFKEAASAEACGLIGRVVVLRFHGSLLHIGFALLGAFILRALLPVEGEGKQRLERGLCRDGKKNGGARGFSFLEENRCCATF